MSIFVRFFKRYCRCCVKRGTNCTNNDTESEAREHDSDRGVDHGIYDPIEEDRLREVRSDSGNDTPSTVPSVITISRYSVAFATRDRRWYRRSRIQNIHEGASATRNDKPALESAAVSSVLGRRFSRSGRNRDRDRERRRRRRRQRQRQRRDRSSFGFPLSPASSRSSSTGLSAIDNYDSFLDLDHVTTLTSSCDDMSLPESGLGVDVADVADAASERNDTESGINDRPSVDPPGSRLDECPGDGSVKHAESYPNAIIQFRNPINGKSGDDACGFSDEEINHFIDFLRHTEEYVRYPRSKLTILLRARPPETDDDREELQHLRVIIADASSNSSAPVSAKSIPSGNGDLAEGQQQQQQQQQPRPRPPLRVDIATVSSGEVPLRCAPTGGLLVTFGSVWELPLDHPDFLKDLVI